MERAISCVTDRILTTEDFRRRRTEIADVVLNRGEAVRLREAGRIHLRVRMRVRLSQSEPPRGLWDAATAAYEDRLSDRDDREIVAYHWHPAGRSHVRAPHLHLGPGAEVDRVDLLTAHLPTGAVPIQDALRLAIETFEAEPARRDWDRVLHRAETPVV
jgi:hypothetical protein